MFGIFSKHRSGFDDAIDRLLEEMNTYDPDSEEYKNALTMLERVIQLRDGGPKGRVSADTMAVILGNLVGILIIVGYERGHVMTTRAKDFVLKTK